MSPLDPLAPDQRAVVSLILQQGRSYDDIAQLLGLPVAAVRSRAHAGLDALAPGNGLPGEITGPLADYLLGQQAERDAEATRGLLAESAPLRDWAAGVAGALADVAPRGLPEIPGATRGDLGSDSDPDAPQTGDDEATRGELTADSAVSAPQAGEAEPAPPEHPTTARPAPAPRSRRTGRRRRHPARVLAARRRAADPRRPRGRGRGAVPRPPRRRRRPRRRAERGAVRHRDGDRHPDRAGAGRRRDRPDRPGRRQGHGQDDRVPPGRAAAVRAAGRPAPRQRREGLVRRLAHRTRFEGTPARVHGSGRRRRQAPVSRAPARRT